MAKIARTVPNVKFPVRIDNDESGFDWGEIDTESIFAGRRILVFSLPGAFTPTCTMNQLPGFEAYFDQLKQYGIDDIYQNTTVYLPQDGTFKKYAEEYEKDKAHYLSLEKEKPTMSAINRG